MQIDEPYRVILLYFFWSWFGIHVYFFMLSSPSGLTQVIWFFWFFLNTGIHFDRPGKGI